MSVRELKLLMFMVFLFGGDRDRFDLSVPDLLLKKTKGVRSKGWHRKAVE